MVFRWTCFSFKYVLDIPRATEDFHTANSQFDDTQTNPAVDPNLKVSATLTKFTLSDLKTATRDFHIDNKIGEGGFAIVYKGRVNIKKDRSTQDVAVKEIKAGKGSRTWVTELNVLGRIDHENLVKLIGYCNEDSQLLLVYEYMPKKSLDGHLKPNSNPPLPWRTRLKIAKDAARGLEHLHNQGIVFRDLKPSNILLDDEWNAKLCDFGFARDGPKDGRSHVSTMLVGTKGYAAPEYVQTGHLTDKIDVWSYGIFLKELITGRPPITKNDPENNSQCLRLVCCYAGAENSELTVDSRLEGKYSERSKEKVILIANKCMAKDPKTRPPMSEVSAMVQDAIELENQ